MSFNILDHLDKLTIKRTYPTWIWAECPVCNGKLTINTGSKRGSYSCWTSNCHGVPDNLESNKVRKLLYNPGSPFNKPSPFARNNYRPIKLIEVVKPIPIDNVNPTDFLTSVGFIRPKQVRKDKTLLTYFEYAGFYIVRTDYINDEGTKNKYFYPLQISEDGTELRELPETFSSIPLYREDYVQSNLVIVEGEKCATIAQYLGLAAITFPSFLYTERYLDRAISYLKNKGLTNVLYIRDNDITGLKKAKSVINFISKYKIGSKIVNVADIYEKYTAIQGYDLYDLYKDESLNRKNVITLIDKCLEF